MKKLLLLLLLLPTLAFGQATGYTLSNFPASGSIGTAATTVDVYSRININQTTPSISLTVPIPTNVSTKVVEVWIGNKGTVSFTLRALPDIDGFVLDTGQAVILKWIGAKYVVIGKGGASTNIITEAPLSYINDTLKIDTTKIPYFSGGISGPKNSVTYLNGAGVWDTLSTGGVLSVTGTTNRITSTGGTTPVIDIDASYVGQPSITNLGTIGTGTWQGTIVAPAYGGTGINNGTKTLTLGGNTAFTGAFNPTFAIPRTTTWTLPNTANETLAFNVTAQDFTAQQTLSSTSGANIYKMNIWTPTTSNYITAIEGVGNQLYIRGLGASMGVVFSSSVLMNSFLYCNSINATTGGGAVTIGSQGRGVILTTNSFGTAAAVKTGFRIVTGDHTGAVAGANTQNIDYITGSTTNAAATGSSTGSHLFDVGTTTSTNTRGGISFFAGFSGTSATEPAWNSGQRIMFIGNRTASPITNATNGTYFYANAGNLETTGSLHFPLIGTGIGVKTGTNGRLFTATLTAGTVTVSNTSVTTATRAIVELAPSGASGTLGRYTYTCTAGQIVITSLTSAGVTETADVSTVQVYLIEGL